VNLVIILTTKVIHFNLARVKCNRCGINKSPKKNVKKPKKQERMPDSQSEEDKKKKPFQERVGDWVCIKCKNLNFSFRVICNRCQLPKVESEKMFDQYMSNLMNYVKFNEVMQKQLVVGQGNPPVTNQGLINNNSININNNFYGNYPKNEYGGNPYKQQQYKDETYQN
jgi:hypothetical protein